MKLPGSTSNTSDNIIPKYVVKLISSSLCVFPDEKDQFGFAISSELPLGGHNENIIAMILLEVTISRISAVLR